MRHDSRSSVSGHVSRRPGHAPVRRNVAMVVLRAAAVTGAAMVTAATVGLWSGPAGASVPGGSATDPTAGHAYRHGAVPLHRRGATPDTSGATGPLPPSRRATGESAGGAVRFGGGSVITGSPAVYLVFWGSQWGHESTDGAGDDVYAGDPDGLAPNLQALFDGLGTDGELWSAIMTQYCEGVVEGAKTCPVTPLSEHVAYPSTTVLRGVWEDTSATPTAPTGTQIAQEASRAAVHFSDPTGAQYVVVSPHGTDPDGWLDSRTGYCAYHDNTGDPSLGTVTGPDVPYTNMPYVPDVGAECSSFADPGPLDGADETISHEYAETLTDPYPSSGWTDRVGNEVADKCEFLAGGSPGGSTYVHLATGTFALQGIWANDLEPRGGCETSHSPILSANPGKQRATEGSAVDLPISAADVRGQTVRYSATGLPAGLAINPSTGVVSGVPTARGRSASSVTVADSSATTTISFVWMVKR